MDEMSLYNELINSWGYSFQEKFSELMMCKYGPEYKSIAPYGNVGDRAVDGVLHQNIAFAAANVPCLFAFMLST